MANYNNYGKKMNAVYDLNEEATANDVEDMYDLNENAALDGRYSVKDVEMKSQNQYHSYEEPTNPGREIQDEGSDGNAAARLGRRTSIVGKWGSSFWKDCQPMWNSKDSDCKRQGGLNGSYEGQKNGEEAEHRGQANIPDDEMLSDDYYERDGDDQSDSFREVSRPSTSGLSLPPKSVTTQGHIYNSMKAPLYAQYDYEDEDEDEEEEEEDEDDPDDADFDPDFGELTNGTKKKGKNLNDDDYDDEVEEGDEDLDDLDISDESDSDFNENHHRNVRIRVQPKTRPSREKKSIPTTNRRNKRKIYSDEEESSAKDSEQDSDDNFTRRARRPSQFPKKNVSRSTFSTMGHDNSEIRTSSRSVRKVSYVESEDSEEVDEEKSAKSQKTGIILSFASNGKAILIYIASGNHTPNFKTLLDSKRFRITLKELLRRGDSRKLFHVRRLKSMF